jgi:hypothetical protein
MIRMGLPLLLGYAGVPMTMTAMIGLGILVWIVLAILVSLVVARMIRLRDHQGLNEVYPVAPPQETSTQGTSADGGESIPRSTG